MGVDYLAKYGKPRKPPPLGDCFEVSDTPVSYIEFRDRANNTAAIQYSILTIVTCNPSTELKLRFGKLKITIKGSNLLPLVQLFSERRVTLCKRSDDRAESRDDAAAFVEYISLPESIRPAVWDANEPASKDE